MRLKNIAVYALACLTLQCCVSASDLQLPERRYYVSTVFSWWPTYRDLSLFRKFVDESKQKGMNSISVDVPWTIEDARGGFDFAESDRRIDYAVEAGLSVFLRLNATTLGGQSPKWLTDDMLQATKDGSVYRRDTDRATIASLSHPTVREHLQRFARAVSEHYGTKYSSHVSGEYPVAAISPALDLYMESEYFPDAEVDYSKAAQKSFAGWVRGYYRNLGNLNGRWGSAYKRWSEVTLAAAHPTARQLFFESELAAVCGGVAKSVRSASGIPVGFHAGASWDNANRRTLGTIPLLRDTSWVFISDAPTYNHAFSIDLARTVSGGRRVASQVDAASHAEATNSRYFNQGVRAFEHGASAMMLANWDLSNMRDNSRWPFLHFVGQITKEHLAHPRPDRAVYVSTWDLVSKSGSIDDYIPTYNALSGDGKNPVDVLTDSVIQSDPGRLDRYAEIRLPANRAIPEPVRKALQRVRERLNIAEPLVAGTTDEYGRPTTALAR